jgi:hypothetical protein
VLHLCWVHLRWPLLQCRLSPDGAVLHRRPDNSMLSGRFGCLPEMTVRNLTVDTVTPYLIERNLVGLDAIVEGDLEIIDVGRRNQSLKIVRRRGPSYVIKQPGEGELATGATIRCEAWFYTH